MRTVSPRLLLVVALVLSLTGTAAAVAGGDGSRPLEVATADGGSVGSGSAGLRPSTTVTAVVPSSSATARAARRSAPTSTTLRVAAADPASSGATPTGPTTTTVLDWRAAGLPGPVGSTIQPWTEAPYHRSTTGNSTTLSIDAAANGAQPGSSMPMTVRGTFSQYTTGGSIVLVGPADYTKPYEEQPRRVIDTWSGPCGAPLGSAVERSVSTTLPMDKIRKPEFEMNNLHYEVFALVTPCEGEPFTDAWFTLDFNVADPWVVVAPNPEGLGHTG